MKIFTDNINSIKNYFVEDLIWKDTKQSDIPDEIKKLAFELYPHDSKLFFTEIDFNPLWRYLFYVEESPNSQYDILIENSNKSELPSGIICLAGYGTKFHGFRNRKWEAQKGNLHLSTFLSPNIPIENFSTGFLIISCVSVVQTLDRLNGLKGKSKIKWVNDILIENSKVSGVLVNAQSQGNKITGAVFGIGLNIDKKPDIEPDEFCRAAGSVRDFINDYSNDINSKIFNILLNSFTSNYEKLINNKYNELFEFYKDKLCIIGKEIKLIDDYTPDNKLIAAGIVEKIDSYLQLYLQNHKNPYSTGRLIIID